MLLNDTCERKKPTVAVLKDISQKYICKKVLQQ